MPERRRKRLEPDRDPSSESHRRSGKPASHHSCSLKLAMEFRSNAASASDIPENLSMFARMTLATTASSTLSYLSILTRRGQSLYTWIRNARKRGCNFLVKVTGGKSRLLVAYRVSAARRQLMTSFAASNTFGFWRSPATLRRYRYRGCRCWYFATTRAARLCTTTQTGTTSTDRPTAYAASGTERARAAIRLPRRRRAPRTRATRTRACRREVRETVRLGGGTRRGRPAGPGSGRTGKKCARARRRGSGRRGARARASPPPGGPRARAGRTAVTRQRRRGTPRRGRSAHLARGTRTDSTRSWISCGGSSVCIDTT